MHLAFLGVVLGWIFTHGSLAALEPKSCAVGVTAVDGISRAPSADLLTEHTGDTEDTEDTSQNAPAEPAQAEETAEDRA